MPKVILKLKPRNPRFFLPYGIMMLLVAILLNLSSDLHPRIEIRSCFTRQTLKT